MTGQDNKIIIAGSRDLQDPQLVVDAIIHSGWRDHIGTVISGGARGVDRLGERWAAAENKVLVYYFADWERYGKRAGFIRNKEMAEIADGLIAVWDGKSPGTRHMIKTMERLGKPVYVHIVKT